MGNRQKTSLFVPTLILNLISYGVSLLVLSVLLSVAFIYRMIAVLLIKFRYKKATMMNGTDTILTFGKGADENQLMYTLLCNGTVDIELFRFRFNETVKMQPKLQCYVQQKYGYYFWMKEKEFNIDDHVIYRSDLSISTKDEWEKVKNSLYYETPLPKNFSPWWVQFIPLNSDYEYSEGGSSFYIVPMWYHCLGDGYSLIYAFLSCLADTENPKLFLPNTGRSSLLKEALILLQGLFLTPSFLPQYIFFKPDFLIRSEKCEKQIYSDLKKIKTETITDIKRITRVPFFVVLLTCMMGALENFFHKSKQPMPREITVSVPQVLWKPDDKIKIANNFVRVCFTIPFSNKSSIERMKEIYKIVKNLQTRNRYMVNYITMKGLAVITPTLFGRWIFGRDNSSVMFSIAALENLPRSVLGQRRLREDNVQRMLTLVGNVRILFQSLTIGDEITLSVHANSTIISKEEVQQITRVFEREIEILKKTSLELCDENCF